MERKEFIDSITGVLKTFGFKKKGRNYYYTNEEVICVIELQKSNFGDYYYVNYAYQILELHPDDKFPKAYQSDIYNRAVLKYNGKNIVEAEYEKLEENELKKSIREFVENELLSILNTTIHNYPVLNPGAEVMMRLQTKQYFGIK